MGARKIVDLGDEEEDTQRGEVILSISDKGITPAVRKEKEKELVIPMPKDLNAGKFGIRKNQDHLMLAKIARGEDVEMEEAEEEIKDDFDGEIIKAAIEDIASDLPLLLRNRRMELESIKDEDERFREDVNSRPDVASLEDYERVPIEKFGEALLRGMDWKPGQQIGLNGKGLSKPIEFVPRPKGLGLGANPSMQKKKHQRKGQKKPDMVVKKDADGRQRHYRTVDEKLIHVDHEKRRFKIGSRVVVVQGIHEGVSGQIEKVLADEQFLVRFASGEDETFEMSDLSLLTQKSHSDKDYRKTSKDSSRKREESKSKRREEERRSSRKEKRTWMREGIIVRIVSKSFKDGKYYCKRVRILDVISNNQCSITVEGRVLEGVKERMIETALPKPGGKVMILSGRNRGRSGTLQSRNSKQNEAVVQHEDDLSIGKYRFEDVAEYAL